jgi:hypothetical protein
MHILIFFVRHNTLLYNRIVNWRLVTALNMGHHQTVIHKDKNIQKLCITYGWRYLTFTLKYVRTVYIKHMWVLSNYKWPKDI